MVCHRWIWLRQNLQDYDTPPQRAGSLAYLRQQRRYKTRRGLRRPRARELPPARARRRAAQFSAQRQRLDIYRARILAALACFAPNQRRLLGQLARPRGHNEWRVLGCLLIAMRRNLFARVQNPSIAPGIVTASTLCSGTVPWPASRRAAALAASGARPDPLRATTFAVGSF